MAGLTLTVGRTEDGRLLAICSRGGHLQIPGSGEMEVLSVEVVKSERQARQWFRQMKRDRPWETRP